MHILPLVFLQFLSSLPAYVAADGVIELGEALLDTQFMPLRLLDPPDTAYDVTPRPPEPVTNASADLAFTTMNFHRRMMNEFLCRGYEARLILEEIQRDTQFLKQKQQRHIADDTLRTRMLMTDQGSTGYSGWLKRSAVLEDLYRHMDSVKKGDPGDLMHFADDRDDDDEEEEDENLEEEEEEDDEIRIVEQERKKNQQKGRQKGTRVRNNKPKGTSPAVRQKKRPVSTTSVPPKIVDNEASPNVRDPDYAEYPEHSPPAQEVVFVDQWTTLGFNAKDLFDITLTALAFLAFGLFILNVFMSIITQRVGPQSVMFVTNNTTPSLPVLKRQIDWSKDGPTLDRIVRWAETPPPLVSNGYIEEKVARLALYSLNAALRPSSEGCTQFALCWGNKMSRNFAGQAKYWLPVWSLGMSWLVRRAGEDPESEASSLFSGALGNVRAAALGLAGVRCGELFPPC